MKFVTVVTLLCLVSSANAAMSKWVAFDQSAGQILIPVTINGVEARAALDSGAASNVISMSFIEKHGIEYTPGRQVTVSGVAGEKRNANLVNGIRLGMFGADFNVSQLGPGNMDSFDFLIGLKFFENFVVQIDYPNSRLRIIDRESIDLRQFSNVKMKRAGGGVWPMIRVDFAGEYKPWLILDTGNSGSILLIRSKVELLGWIDRYEMVETAIGGVTGSVVKMDTFSMPSMTIGPFELGDVLVSVEGADEDSNLTMSGLNDLDWSTGTHIRNRKSEGIIGYDILRHFILTIDYKRSLLNLDLPRSGGGAEN